MSGSGTPVALQPKDGPSWVIIGQAEAKRGRRAEAIAALEKARALLPERYHAEILETIRKLKKR